MMIGNSRQAVFKAPCITDQDAFAIAFVACGVRLDGFYLVDVVYYGDVDHPVPGQIDHWVS